MVDARIRQTLAGTEFALDGVTASAEVFCIDGSVARTELAYQSQTDPIATLMSTLSASGGIAAPIFVAGEMWAALGAAYSDKPIPPGAECRLERFARLVGLTISNTEARDTLARQASTDPLTGLANRRAFNGPRGRDCPSQPPPPQPQPRAARPRSLQTRQR